jgi:hypothetical protein
MHEKFRQRLEALETARKLQRDALQKDAAWETTRASGPANFVSRRRADEPLSDFESRCDNEFRIAFPKWPLPPVFVLGHDRIL